MRSPVLWAYALTIGIASAFEDASPFFLASTSRCPSQTYIVVEQRSARLADFTGREAAPALRRLVQKEDTKVLSSYVIPEVVAKIDAEELSRHLSTQCQAQRLNSEVFTGLRLTDTNISPTVVTVHGIQLAPGESRTGRLNTLRFNDDRLGHIVDKAASLGDYTVIYITTPPSLEAPSSRSHQQQIYDMDDFELDGTEHIELKRDFNGHIRAAENSSLPLFETYQFLSPETGLFMGGVVTLLLLLILYVGVTAIASLEVSYMAFSKEMGPAAQKKQQ
ncbi:MAG: hypothetical protein Q9157_001365 [Trypethelium eluteriae]